MILEMVYMSIILCMMLLIAVLTDAYLSNVFDIEHTILSSLTKPFKKRLHLGMGKIKEMS